MRPPAGARRRHDRPAIALVIVAAVLVASGAITLGRVGWDLSVGSAAAAAQQQRAARNLASTWATSAPSPAPIAARDGAVPVGRAPAAGGDVAVLRIPRFGKSWRRIVREGIGVQAVLNSATAGVGHYPGAAMPGGVGNFAIAAHDTGYGDAFLHVADLRIGDLISVQTRLGWYTYEFRNFQWVPPSEVAVILPVPERPSASATERLITLTTCDPPFDAQEREIAYGTFVSFRPAADGPPSSTRS